jgi:hypothetical protein
MNDIQNRIGLFAGKIAQLEAESGLAWDEAVASFGLATKALAIAAHDNGDGRKKAACSTRTSGLAKLCRKTFAFSSREPI